MIVKCEQCQTRFKIPDDKVTEKGVKVRCTKCAHTFRVTRDGGSPPGSEADAAAPPSAASDPFARFGAPAPPATRSPTAAGAFALGPDSSGIDEARRGRGGAPIPPAPFPIPEAPSVYAGPRSGGAFDFAPMGAGAPPVPPAPSPFDFGALAPTSRSAEPAASMPSASSAPAPFDFSSLGPPPGAAPQQASAYAPPQSSPGFDFSALGPPSSDRAAPGAPAEAPDQGPDAGSLPPSAYGEMLPGISADGAAMFPPQDVGFGDSLMDSSADMGAPPGLEPSDAGRASLFELSARSPLPTLDLPAPDERAPRVSPQKPQVVPAPQPRGEVPAPAPPRPVAPEASRGENVGDEASQRRPVVAIVVNVGIAFVLLVALLLVGSVFVNEGKLDSSSFSPERLKAMFSPASNFVAEDISNGLYETRAGRAVFFVRGEVTNTGATAARVKVRAEILEGSSLVRAVEGFAGLPPTPEELSNLGSSDDLDRLLARQASGAKPVEPGASAPFVVAFFEYPPDLKAFRVRVEATAASSGPAAP